MPNSQKNPTKVEAHISNILAQKASTNVRNRNNVHIINKKINIYIYFLETSFSDQDVAKSTLDKSFRH